MSVTRIGPKHQITIPVDAFTELGLEAGDILDVQVDGEGLRLVPQKLVPRDQAWFWSKEWQEGEREAEADIQEGRTSGPFDSAEELMRHLRGHEA
ncbi:MAG TPA: AbrB/MazE/SpoVT family DNA-binding domain-containing protein [Chloroflexota bacterium]|jgi:AbrB family looped-hinge helix DNA binding protein